MSQIMALRKSTPGEGYKNIMNGTATKGGTAANVPDEEALLMNDDDDDDDDEEEANTTSRGIHDGEFNGPKLITFDGDQTLYSDGANFESNPRLATYLYRFLKEGVNIAVVTAAGYEYNVDKYEFRLSGLLAHFKHKGLTPEECDRFYLFGGECNFLMKV